MKSIRYQYVLNFSKEEKMTLLLIKSWDCALILKELEYFSASKLIKESVRTSYEWIIDKTPIFNRIYEFVPALLELEHQPYFKKNNNLVYGIFCPLNAILYNALEVEHFQRINYPSVPCNDDSILAETDENTFTECIEFYFKFIQAFQKNQMDNHINLSTILKPEEYDFEKNDIRIKNILSMKEIEFQELLNAKNEISIKLQKMLLL